MVNNTASIDLMQVAPTIQFITRINSTASWPEDGTLFCCSTGGRSTQKLAEVHNHLWELYAILPQRGEPGAGPIEHNS